MLEKLEVVRQMFGEASKARQDILVEESAVYLAGGGFDYQRFFAADAQAKLRIIL